MLDRLKAIVPRYYFFILLSELLILPFVLSLFFHFQPILIYISIASAFLLFFIPGFAITSFLRNLTLFERIALSLAFGLLVMSTIIFTLNKFGLPINNFITLSLMLLVSSLIWINRKNFYLQHSKKQNKFGIDFYDLLAVLIGLLAFFMMLIPISLFPTPYGEADAGWHYYASNYIRENSKLPDIVPEFAHFYAGEKYTYPPVTHINIALFGKLFNIPQLYSPYIYVAFLHMILGFGVYALVKRQFGKIEAIGALVFTLVSTRLMFSMISGQWAFYTALATLPISIFLILNFYKEQNAKIAIFTGLLFGLQAYTHPQIVGHSALIFIIYGIFWFLVNRKIPNNLYFIPIASLIAIPALLSPQTIDINRFETPIDKFYLWYPTGEYYGNYFAGYPKHWYDFSIMNERILYFAIAGTASWFFFFRKNYLLISLLVSLFVLFHLPMDPSILARYMVNEFILVSILAGISFSLLNPLVKRIHAFVPFIVIIILIGFIYFHSTSLEKGLYLYSGKFRMTEDEFNLLLSIRDLPEGKTFYLGYYEFARQASWAPYLSEHTFYFPNMDDINNTLTLNFQNETKYLFLSNAHMSENLKGFLDSFSGIMIEQGCRFIKSYPTAILLSADCLKTNKLSLKYELI